MSVFESEYYDEDGQRLDVEAVQGLIVDLGYDYDRMSMLGQEIYNLLCRHIHVPEIEIVPPKKEMH